MLDLYIAALILMIVISFPIVFSIFRDYLREKEFRDKK